MVHEYIRVSGQMETDGSSEGMFCQSGPVMIRQSDRVQADAADMFGGLTAVQVVPSRAESPHSAMSITPGEMFRCCTVL